MQKNQIKKIETKNENEFDLSFFDMPEETGSADGFMKLDQGDNRIRLFTDNHDMIKGNVLFSNQPDGSITSTRKRGNFTIKEDPSQAAKHFKAFVVYNYRLNKIQILDLKQATILKAIESLTKSSEWGNPAKYDITINKKGEKLLTKYSVQPHPHKSLSAEIQQQYEATPIHLAALFENKNPFELPVNF